MPTIVARLCDEEPLSTPVQIAIGKVCQRLLLLLCVAPIALFPIGLAYKAYMHYLL